MRYHVKKNKVTRISYRILGVLFILVAGACIFAVYHMTQGARLMLLFMALFLIAYGGYLFKMSFRRQAYDMIYEFEDAGLTLHFKGGQEKVPYGNIEDVEILAPDPDMTYRIVRIQIHGVQYVLPFPDNIALAEQIFTYVDSRIVLAKSEHK